MASRELVAFGVIRSRRLVKLRTVPWRMWELRERARVQDERELETKEDHDGNGTAPE